MRDDQWTKLQELEIKLADVLIHEADPETWTGARKHRTHMSATDLRKRRVGIQCANQTISLMARIMAYGVMRDRRMVKNIVNDGDSESTKLAREAEARVTEALARIRASSNERT